MKQYLINLLVITIFFFDNNLVFAFNVKNPNSPTGFSIAKVTGTDKGTNVSFTDPYNPSQTMNVWAGPFQGTIDGNNARFFCIDIQNLLAIGHLPINTHTQIQIILHLK